MGWGGRTVDALGRRRGGGAAASAVRVVGVARRARRRGMRSAARRSAAVVASQQYVSAPQSMVYGATVTPPTGGRVSEAIAMGGWPRGRGGAVGGVHYTHIHMHMHMITAHITHMTLNHCIVHLDN